MVSPSGTSTRGFTCWLLALVLWVGMLTWPLPELSAAGPEKARSVSEPTGSGSGHAGEARSVRGPAPAPVDTLDLSRAVVELMAEHRIPGVGLALVSRDSLIWVGSWGVADRNTGQAVDATTVFRAGEISESVTAVVALILAREGRIALDDPVVERIPDFGIDNAWAPGQPVRIVHLFEHTAGFGALPLWSWGLRDPDLSLRDGLERVLGGVRWPPGSFHLPSPVGPSVGAYLLEEVSEEPFEELAARRVFVPLGMEVADFRLTSSVERSLAQGHRGAGRTPVPYGPPVLPPSAGLNASPRELGAFVRLLLGRGSVDGVELLPEELVSWMERPATGPAARAGLDAGYGFGLATSVGEGFVFLGRAGSIDGFAADFGYLPNEGLGYVLMTNSSGPGFDDLRGVVRSHLVRELGPPPRPPRAQVSPERIRAWTGYYEQVTPEHETARFLDRLFSITRVTPTEDGSLRVRRLLGDDLELVPVGPSQLRLEDEPVATVAFLTDERNRLVLSGTGSALRGGYVPVPAWGAWTRWTVASGVAVLIASALLLSLWWAPRWFKHGVPAGERWTLRVLPAAASWCLLLSLLLLLAATGDEEARRLGLPTFWSVGIFVLVLLFSLSTLAALVEAVRAREAWGSRGVRLHALLVSGANLLVLIYLGAHGLVGFRPWTG